MSRLRILCLLALGYTLGFAAEPAELPHTSIQAPTKIDPDAMPTALATHASGGVTVTLHLIQGTTIGEHSGEVLLARFTPTAEGDGWHLYGTDLPEAGIELFPGTFLGRPTKVGLPEGSPLRFTAEAIAVPAMERAFNSGMQREINQFPSGVVDLLYPLERPAEGGEFEVLIWYMLCREAACMKPTSGQALTITLPAIGD